MTREEKIEYLAKAVMTLSELGDNKTAYALNEIRLEMKGQTKLPEGPEGAVEGSDFRDKFAAYMKSAAVEGGYVLSSETILKMAEKELLKRGVVQKSKEMKEDKDDSTR